MSSDSGGGKTMPAGRSRSMIDETVLPVFPHGVDRARDEIEAERRASPQRSELQARMIVAVRLAVRIVRVDEKDRSIGSAGERARLLVDRITQGFDRATDFFTCLRPNILFVVQHSGHGHPGDPCSFRHIVDGEFARAHARRLASALPLRNSG